jgi:hypothetical protein
VRQKYDTEIAVHTMGDCLKRWGFTSQKPGKRECQSDEKKVKERINATYLQIDAQAKEEGVIHFCDEAGIHTDQFNGGSYASKRKTPIIMTACSRLKLNVISSLSKERIIRFMTYIKTMNCRLFIAFMKPLIQSSAWHKIFSLLAIFGSIMEKWQ